MKKAGKIVFVIVVVIVAWVVFQWYAYGCHLHWEARAITSEESQAESKAFRVFCGDDHDVAPTIVTDARPR